MKIEVGAHLTITSVGPWGPALRRLATFRRIGRLRPGQKRLVRYYQSLPHGGGLLLPRGLLGTILQLDPHATVHDRRLKRPAVDFGWRGGLRDYQEAAVRTLIRYEGGTLEMDPGGGKTRVFLRTVAAWRQPTLWLTDKLRLANQTLDAAREHFVLPPSAFGYVGEGVHQVGSHFTVALFQTLAKNPALLKEMAGQVGAVLVDECFVGGTLVEGRPIESYAVGDTVVTYDPRTQRFAPRPVTAVLARSYTGDLIRVETATGTILCTPNHPWWTRRGWVAAGDLAADDRILRAKHGWEGLVSLGTRPVVEAPVYNLSVAGPHTYTVAGGYVVHNCHHTASATFSAVVSQFPAYYRAGASGTPDRDDGLGPLVTALLGPRFTVPTAVLRARNVVMVPTVYLVRTKFAGLEDGARWVDTEKARAQDRERNQIIGQIVWQARRRGQRILVLVDRKDHARILARMLEKAGIPAAAVVGTVPPELQARRLADMEAGRLVAIATKLANEGLDYPRMDCLILAAAARSLTGSKQKTGRVVRTADGKRWAYIYDLVDLDVDTYAAQVQERVAFYREAGYTLRRWTPPRRPPATSTTDVVL